MGFTASFSLPPDDSTANSSNSSNSIVDCEIEVLGMTCGKCVANITGHLNEAEGVKKAKVDLELKRAFVTIDLGVTSAGQVANVINGIGTKFTARVLKDEVRVRVIGMKCQSCVNKIESGLKDVDGVNWVKVLLDDKEARVRYDHAVIEEDRIVKLISDMGFEASLMPSSENVDAKSKGSKVNKEVTLVAMDDEDDNGETEKCFLRIEGMTCASCVAAIEKHVKKLNGECANRLK